jgi:hypothetical protein
VQNITVEIQNLGSTDFDAQITETIYNLSNGTKLNQLAVYVDSSVHLNPGNTRMHKVIFVPETLGSYFIKATVHYGQRVAEQWGSFEVIEQNLTQPTAPPPNQTNETNETQPPPDGGGGGGGPTFNGTGNGTGNASIIQVPPAPPGEIVTLPPNVSNYSIKLEYPDRIKIYRNITNLLSVKVINNGRNALNNIVFYASYPDIFGIDINPKTPQSLTSFDQSVTYVISLYTSNASLQEYPFDFEVNSNELKSNGTVMLDVRESPESLRELIEEKLINYKILISDISAEIEAASLRNLDVSVPLSFINSAKRGINNTENLYNAARYEDALDELEKVEADIRDAVFTLGNLSLRLYAVQRIDYLLLLFIIAILAALVLVWYRRRRDRRPRLLQRAKEE